MKTLILSLLGCGMALAQPVFDFGLANNIVQGQTVTAATLVTNYSGTNALVGAGITNPVLNLALHQNLGAVLAFKPMGTNAGDKTLTVTFARSVDGLVWETTPRFAVAATVTGTNAIAFYTNLSGLIGPAGWLTNVSVVSTETDCSLTNVSLKLGGKLYSR